MHNLALYIHYPFCKSKCPYCDFNSHVSNNIPHQEFCNAYLTELDYFYKKIGKRKITSIFFGGGTPSLMPINTVDKIINKIDNLWHIAKNTEITLEANPTSSEAQKFQDLTNIGINRLSLGIQALNDQDLKFLGREHSAQEALDTIQLAQKYFDNMSFDLIYARPEQSLKQWQKELETAISLKSQHLSLYQLTIEKGTKFFSDYKNNKFTMVNNELQSDLYDLTQQICTQNNFELYEISNYSKNNLHSKHNLSYWNYDDYLGIGAGSHSRITINNVKKALMNYHKPQKWLDKITSQKHAMQQDVTLNNDEIYHEMLFMGLRTKFGVNQNKLNSYIPDNKITSFNNRITDLINENLLTIDNNYLKATYSGLKKLNSLCSYLLQE